MSDIKERVKQVWPTHVATLNDIISTEVGKEADLLFNANTYHYIIESEIQSPIEAMFYAAFMGINEISYHCGLRSTPSPFIGSEEFLIAFPQHEVGKYKADFGVFYGIISSSIEDGYSYSGKWVAVELDGHEFHDRDESQRRYEKRRDRYFQKSGLQIFRYTGSEIFKNPFNAAVEVIAHLMGLEEEELWNSLPEEFKNLKLSG